MPGPRPGASIVATQSMETMQMLNTETLEHSLTALAATLDGDVVTPADPEWDLGRRAWNLAADQRPALVVFPAHADDVVAICDFARAHSLKIAPQGTGHNASAIASLRDTILLSTQRMRGVEIDADRQSARVQAGTLWLEVTEASTPHGLFPLSGSSPDVGVVGYTLGGGLSWLGRKHGLAANNVTAIELVTPDGRHVRATADEEADLFWALRGGGGNFGVVTAMEFRLFHYGEVYAGMLLWPYERAGDVLHAWHSWTRTAPEEITTSMRIMHLPPMPELPEFLRGRSVVVIDGAYAGDAEAGARALAPLRALGPEIDTFAPSTPAMLSRIHMDPEEPMPAASASAMFRSLDAQAIDTFAAHVRPGSPLLFAELRHVGGALGRVPDGAGAVGSFDGEYLYFTAGLALGPEMARAVREAGNAALAALAPYESGSAYLNFVEQPTNAARFYTPDAYARLSAVRADVDPDAIMVGNHPIPVA
jgi:FAD/FMN-containing dehydrogenase